ncbi:DUF2334 domain-containing protein [Halobacillus kuroshimensis]|uniref:DUF2334 domain-containing protein n=1 Tax=Halobacillus kuroshimensis TaxID=302481 RepID=A0ABS3DV39_9BACI|nr:DUF2334 domain-containing protein [Halobacillus kuroshimensis]MBN8235219.1 DUF2334 domain-containing protein [Halobacillus kuroshimensis]
MPQKILLFLWMVLAFPFAVSAQEEQGIKEPPFVTIVYSSDQGESDQNIKKLDFLISHFTTKQEWIDAGELKPEDLEKTTHLLYFGAVQHSLSNSTRRAIDQFNGIKTAFGYNADQLEGFDFYQYTGEKRLVTELSGPFTEEKLPLTEAQQVLDIKASDAGKIWLYGEYKGTSFPLLIQEASHYYYGDTDISYSDSIALSEVFHEIFGMPHSEIHPGFLRLEDVNPTLDPTLLMDCADFLFSQDIPFMVSVTPVYKNPGEGETYYLEDAPQLIEALQTIQNKGAVIVLHGYTDQHGEGVSGDGFEFSPEENEQMNEENLQQMLNNKLQKGIHQLAAHDLVPYGFESSHYSLTKEGYRTVSRYFPIYIGQVQLSDSNWMVMEESPVLTKPDMLNNMTFIPETLRFQEDGNTSSIDDMMERASRLQFTRDSVMSAFYHPYMGVDGLKEMIKELNTIPGLVWQGLPVDPYKEEEWLGEYKKEPQVEKPAETPALKKREVTFTMEWLPIITGISLSSLVIGMSYMISIRKRREDEF